VHAESAEAKEFYLHWLPEFEPSPTDDLHLVLLMKDICRTYGSMTVTALPACRPRPAAHLGPVVLTTVSIIAGEAHPGRLRLSGGLGVTFHRLIGPAHGFLWWGHSAARGGRLKRMTAADSTGPAWHASRGVAIRVPTGLRHFEP